MKLEKIINRTRLYYYDNETLTFEKGKWLYILYISIFFNILIIGGLLSNNIDINFKYKNTLKVLGEKNKIINHLENRDQDSITEWNDFRKSLPLKLSSKEEKRLNYLYFKYKDLISKHHCPNNLLWYIAYKESRLDSDAKNSKSSAKGMFQFINGTWNIMCKRGGMDVNNRYSEEKQVKVMCIYLDYLFDKYKNWQQVHKEYCGGVLLYKLPYYK